MNKLSKLAIHGGTPIRETFLPYGRQKIEDADIQAVINVLQSDWLTTGPKVEQFEKDLSDEVGSQHAVSFSSGTAALHCAMLSAGLGPGDEAITTPLTFCATPNSIIYTGAKPVFVDVSMDTLNIDPNKIESAITDNTKAIVPVDYSGHPSDLKQILDISERYGLTVIEDAAHALGSTYKNEKIGSISHMTMFSFHPVKHVTTGEGGAITTNDTNLAIRLQMFRNHGINPASRINNQDSLGPWYYEMEELGYNYRLTDIACALGSSQLKRLHENIRRRREISNSYTKALSNIEGLVTPEEQIGSYSSWHIYPIRLDNAKLQANKLDIFKALRSENIGVNVHFIPVHLHPYYRKTFGYVGGEYPLAESAYQNLLTLPLFHSMNNQDVQDVISAINKVIQYYLSA